MMLAKRVVEHFDLSGFEIDEADQVMRKRRRHRPRVVRRFGFSDDYSFEPFSSALAC